VNFSGDKVSWLNDAVTLVCPKLKTKLDGDHEASDRTAHVPCILIRSAESKNIENSARRLVASQ